MTKLCLLLLSCAAALRAPSRVAPRVAVARRMFGGMKVPGFENPFDDRPGATVGALQVALGNRDMAAAKVVARSAEKFEKDRSRTALPTFIADVATELCRKSDAWLYAAAKVERFDPGRAEKGDHERAYNVLVDREAAKFEVERTPSSDELDATAAGVKGVCVVSLVFALEGDFAAALEGAAASEAAMVSALTDVAAAARAKGGRDLFDAEVLWTPSSSDEALFAPEMLLAFPELLAL